MAAPRRSRPQRRPRARVARLRRAVVVRALRPRPLTALRAPARRHGSDPCRQRHREHLGRGGRRRRTGGDRARSLGSPTASCSASVPATTLQSPATRGPTRRWSRTWTPSTRSRPRCPRHRRVLAALGPRMLELAAARAAGAHPYFVPLEHTAFAARRARTRPAPRPGGRRCSRDGPGPRPCPGPRVCEHVSRPAQLHGEPAPFRLRRRGQQRRRQRSPH